MKSCIFLVFVLTYGRDWLKRVFVVKYFFREFTIRLLIFYAREKDSVVWGYV